ncbi:MAG: thiamine phosphate synthase [Nitrospinae bacterium]|nr:thiamine phosphate synthase [Nitrospinota bacterium]
MPQFDSVDIYPVTGRSLFGERDDGEVIASLAAGGAKIVQLREKSLADGALYDLALLYRRETARHGMLLIINDRVDIAQLCGADGVHLGRGDLPVAAARALLGAGAIIGASSHTLEQALEAQRLGASYVNIGPLFPTPTKPGASAIGLEPVRQAARALSIPFTVMGGVTTENIDAVIAAGARKVGVVSAIFGARDIAAATRALITRMRGADLPVPGAA